MTRGLCVHRQTAATSASGVADSTTGGWADIKVKTDSGNTLSALLNVSGNATTLVAAPINSANWYWSNGGSATPSVATFNSWNTGAVGSNGQLAYPAGTYTVTVESHLNNMNANYLNGGAAYSTKTVSAAATVTIASNTVSLSANKDSVVRSKPFSVTITGRPNTVYHLWVKGTNTMDGTYDNQPPMLAPYQSGVTVDNQTWVGELRYST